MDRETKLDIIEIGRGYVGMILLAVLMYTGMVSATYGGECESIDLSELNNNLNVVWTVVGNSSDMNGTSMTYNNSIVNVCFAQNFKPDEFTLVFFNEQIKEIHTGGGGGTTTEYVDRNVTVYVPEYVDRNITTEVEVEVEKEVKSIEYRENPNSVYYILFALVLGGIIMWVTSRFFGRGRVEEEDKYDYDEE